ncbi:hypothetical protein BHE74_00009339 [Ensete ventricosum]|nr:hypothetical protein BHE74_00009339 [Ensete ventricosum]
MSQECSAPNNLEEDIPPATQPTSGGARQPPFRTPGQYWCLFNDPKLTPPLLNLGVPAVTPEAFQGLTNQAQLRLMNQRIDDVYKTIRMKDEYGKSPLWGSPFIQEIQDTPIPQHFRLQTLEAYDGGSDPMEHVVAFRA